MFKSISMNSLIHWSRNQRFLMKYNLQHKFHPEKINNNNKIYKKLRHFTRRNALDHGQVIRGNAYVARGNALGNTNKSRPPPLQTAKPTRPCPFPLCPVPPNKNILLSHPVQTPTLSHHQQQPTKPQGHTGAKPGHSGNNWDKIPPDTRTRVRSSSVRQGGAAEKAKSGRRRCDSDSRAAVQVATETTRAGGGNVTSSPRNVTSPKNSAMTIVTSRKHDATSQQQHRFYNNASAPATLNRSDSKKDPRISTNRAHKR